MKEDNLSYLRVLLFMISFIPTFFYVCTIIIFFIHNMPFSSYGFLCVLAICSLLASLFLGKNKYRWVGIISVLVMILVYYQSIIIPYDSLVNETYIIGIILIVFYIIYDFLLRKTLTIDYY
ncbi:MAG: hypothetical protein LUG60_02835 [Erysipelotrichaceae bacterium]|nr:hypothetical protein [Erysipelotrichaceae bacterium]